MLDLRQTTTERNALRERLQMATESQVMERTAHDQRINEMNLSVKMFSNEKAEMESQVCSPVTQYRRTG